MPQSESRLWHVRSKKYEVKYLRQGDSTFYLPLFPNIYSEITGISLNIGPFIQKLYAIHALDL